ncbi:MAG TPA: response regulator [Terriglobales bacterium]
MSDLRVLIVDDEPLSRRGIRQFLGSEKDVEVVGESPNGIDAVSKISELRPDIVFLDIQMPDLDGFGVIECLDSEKLPLIIFVTAFDEHAIRAFEVHAFDYVLKPFDQKRVLKALQRARTYLDERHDAKVRREMMEMMTEVKKHRPLERFVVRENDRIFFVPVAEVTWIEAAGNYACIHLQKKTHILRETMTNLETRLAGQKFVRVRKSAIVNGSRIREVRPLFNGEYELGLTDGTTVTSSRRFRRNIQEFLEP